jgi:hypothetical protein
MICVVAALVLAPQVVEAKITSVSVFKNGYSYVIREVNLPGSGDYVLSEMPSSTLGTFWILPGPGVQLDSITIGSDMVESQVPLGTMDRLLAENVGREVSLEVDGRMIKGVLVSANSEMVVLRNEGELYSISRHRVYGARLPLDSKTSSTTKSEVSRFRIGVNAPKGGKMSFVSLQTGLTWAPMYWVDTTQKGKLELICRGSLLNSIGDLRGASAKLVSGEPNLPYVSLQDPLFSGDALKAGISGGFLPPGIDQISFDPVDNSIVVRGGEGGGGGGGFGGRPVTQNVTSRTAEDLFFYSLPKLTVGKDERAYVPLFSATESYKKVLSWRVMPRGHAFESRQFQAFWHTLLFKNTGTLPFSEGVATVYNNDELVGQGRLDYTPVGGEAELAFSRDASIEGEATEEEMSREARVMESSKDVLWDRVRIKGTLLVRNLKKESEAIRIRHAFNGEFLVSSEKAEVVKEVPRYQAVQPTTRIEWNVTVLTGREKTITYEYSVLVPAAPVTAPGGMGG